ncbi:MAG: glycyl-radical enzyme activating protein [Ruminococcaceae bacterium]|nr:glycyl-radical enzyme activating protein [Oscillospiraceae bacterium]
MEQIQRKIMVTKIQKFCTHDGPGVRTTVFMKGCPLRCRWCHNPETHQAHREIYYNDRLCIGCGACIEQCRVDCHKTENGRHIYERSGCLSCGSCAASCPGGALECCGEEKNVEEIIGEVLKDKAFYGSKGGITISGGEPMADPQGAVAIMQAAKRAGLSTALETCGYFDAKWIPVLADCTDHFLWDIKDCHDPRHIKNTGVSNRRILENLTLLEQYGAEVTLRCIMLRGVNMDEYNLGGIASLFLRLNCCKEVELLPYHPFGDSKRKLLGLEEAQRQEWIPGGEEMEVAKQFLKACGVRVK